MTKAELIEAILTRVEDVPTRTQAASLLEDTVALAKEALVRGEEVKLSSFGRFTVKAKTPRMGRNPQTGAAMLIDGRRVVTFAPSRVLRDRLNRTR